MLFCAYIFQYFNIGGFSCPCRKPVAEAKPRSLLSGNPWVSSGALENNEESHSGVFWSFPQRTGTGFPSRTVERFSQCRPPAAASIVDPPFLRHPVLFDPNSLEPSLVGRNMLQRAAIWLREHRETRVLIVGSCDSSGSETCTHALAEGRGAAIQKLLRSFGVGSNQVLGVKGWDDPDHRCRPAEIKCQQLSRSVRIFMASSATPEEKP